MTTAVQRSAPGGGHEGRVVLAGRLASSVAQRLTFTAT